MAKLVRVETNYQIFVAEMTDEQLQRYNDSDEGVEEVIEELEESFEFIRDKDGGIEHWIEEDSGISKKED